MKNLYLLPTHKPSRLCKSLVGLHLTEPMISTNDVFINQNICITSDEEIKEGDWVYSEARKTLFKVKSICNSSVGYLLIEDDVIMPLEINKVDCKKIILTTDQDLIKDGVQAIDDTFLEWFVKNPSCEYIEVTPYHIIPSYLMSNEKPLIGYKIIIPKEETLEEAAKNYAHKSFIWPLNKQGEKQSIPPGQLVPPGYVKHQKITTKYFINGAKWQQERSYSEEDLISLLEFNYKKDTNQLGILRKDYSQKIIKEWFEQFKKKTE